jgi:hypothetical protein
MKKRYFKVLNAENRSCNGGSTDLKWSLPVQNADGTWTPGEWMPEVKGTLTLCKNGYHLTDTEHLLNWLNSTIYEAEPSSELIRGDDKVACRSVRLLKKMNWDDRIARLFACDCAERVLPLYEKNYPDDKRPRYAVEVARLFADGKATQTELAAAGAAAWDAAGNAAGNAAEAAAWAAETKWQIKRLMWYLRK